MMGGGPATATPRKGRDGVRLAIYSFMVSLVYGAIAVTDTELAQQLALGYLALVMFPAIVHYGPHGHGPGGISGTPAARDRDTRRRS